MSYHDDHHNHAARSLQRQQQQQQGQRNPPHPMANSPRSPNNNAAAVDRQSLTWSRVVPHPGSTPPPPRSGAASVVVRGRLYMFGGYGGGTGRLDDFYSFSFSTNAWEEVRVLSRERPGCRENNGVVIGDSSRVYLFGGYNGTSWLNDLWSFDIDTARWECIQESSDAESEEREQQHQQQQPAAAAGGPVNGAAAGGGSALLQPGLGSSSTNAAPSRRFGYVSVVHRGKFVLFGGFDGSKWLNDMHEFDFSSKTWREVHARGALPSVRSCPAWAKDDSRVYIQGGYDGVERKADFFACDLSTYTWTEMPCRGAPPSPRYFHSCCLYGNKMYAYGGYSGSERLADMYAYDFETNHWSEVGYGNLNPDECPSGRSSLVAQVYENSLYIFGGYNGVTVLNDFYKFRLKPVSIPPPVLVHDLYRLINREEYSDVTFLVEGKEVHANRAILAARSEYFRAMLYGSGMRESAQGGQITLATDGNTGDTPSSPSSSSASAPIEVRDVGHEVFLKVLEYLYTDSVSDVPSLDVGVDLLVSSERFMLDRLKGLCEDALRRDIDSCNVIGLFIAAHRHRASGLKDIALEFILQNIKDPAVIHGLGDLKMEPDLLVEIIKRSSAGGVAGAGGAFGAGGMMGGFGGGGGGGGGGPDAGAAGSSGGGGGGRGGMVMGNPFGGSSEWSGTRR